MNFIFSFLISLAILILLVKNPSLFLSSVMSASEKSLELTLKMVGIYAFWLGILKVLEKTGVISKISKFLSPLIKFLFPKNSEKATEHITVNISSNLLGIGNASTPMAIAAMREMKKGEKATKNMVMLFVLNATSLQILPTTLISLRASFGSASPSSILVPTLIASFCSTVLGVVLVKVFVKD